MDKLKAFGAFIDVKKSDLSEEQRSKMVSTTWTVVYKPQGNNGEGLTKARLCARGDYEKDMFRTDSPTCAKGSLRLGLSVASSRNWKISSLDFTSAFIQGQDIDRELFLLPPPEIRKDCPDLVWKVKKRVYGLRDAPRGWWLEVDSSLKELGCQRLKLDHAFYVYFDKKSRELLGFVASHVDDFLYAGNDRFHKEIIDPIKKKYVIGACEDTFFSFTGWNLEQTPDGITVSQKDYLDGLDLTPFDILQNLPGKNDDKLTDEQVNILQRANGVLGWLCQVSKPELAYYYVEFSALIRRATIGDAKRLIKLLHKAKADLSTIKFANLGDVKDWKIKVFCDASFGHMSHTDTVTGELVVLEGQGGKCAILEWSANKLSVPANSPLNGESEAAIKGQGLVHHYRMMLFEIFNISLPGVIVTDSKSLYDAVNTNNQIKDKRTSVNLAILRAVSEEDNMKICWIPGQVQPADILTKPSVNPSVIKTLMKTGNLSCLKEFEGLKKSKK